MQDITPDLLRKARQVEGMTQKEAADKLGISRGYLSMIENGKVKPTDKLQRKIEKLFRKTLNHFFY